MAVCLAREIMPPPPAIYSRACAFDDNSSAADLTPAAVAGLGNGSGFDGFGALQGGAVSGDMVFPAGGRPIDGCRFFPEGLWRGLGRSRRLLGGGRSLCGRCLFGCRGLFGSRWFCGSRRLHGRGRRGRWCWNHRGRRRRRPRWGRKRRGRGAGRLRRGRTAGPKSARDSKTTADKTNFRMRLLYQFKVL